MSDPPQNHAPPSCICPPPSCPDKPHAPHAPPSSAPGTAPSLHNLPHNPPPASKSVSQPYPSLQKRHIHIVTRESGDHPSSPRKIRIYPWFFSIIKRPCSAYPRGDSPSTMLHFTKYNSPMETPMKRLLSTAVV